MVVLAKAIPDVLIHFGTRIFVMNDIVLIGGANNTENIFPEEILCLLKIRNEILRIRSVLEHHRAIGVDRFFIVDNCSDDGTVDFLMSQSDVALFAAHEEFKSSHAGAKWLHSILDTFCEGRWSLIVDGDELFVYPYFEIIDLGALSVSRYLDYKCSASMLTKYSKAPIRETVHKQTSSLLDTCQYFDPGPYDVYPSPEFPFIKIRGGARRRCFWDANTNGRPPPSARCL